MAAGALFGLQASSDLMFQRGLRPSLRQMTIVLPPDFHLGAEGPLIAIATAVGGNAGVSRCGITGNVIAVFDIAPLLIPFCVGGENTDSRTRPDAVARLPLLRGVILY